MIKKTLILGLPYFSKKLSEDLSCYDDAMLFYLCDISTRLGRIKTYLQMFVVDNVYFIGGPYKTSKVLKVAFLLRKRVFIHWVGTDVTNLKKNIESGLMKQNLNTSKIVHFCEVDWIKNELKDIGINAQIVQICGLEIPHKRTPLREVKVLGYLGAGREDFYGFKSIVKLAIAFPHIEFRIVGSSGYGLQFPENITFLGWVKDMGSEYLKASIYIRFPEHDGLPFSVLEAMSYGLYVLYNNSLPGVIYCENETSLQREFNKLQQDLNKQKIDSFNHKGYAYIEKNFSKNKVYFALIEKLK